MQREPGFYWVQFGYPWCRDLKKGAEWGFWEPPVVARWDESHWLYPGSDEFIDDGEYVRVVSERLNVPDFEVDR